MRIRKGDSLIVVVLLIIGMIIIYNNFFRSVDATGNIAILEVDGKIVEQFPLDSTLDDYRVDTESGYNILTFDQGMVKIKEADCPDQICVNFGWAKQAGQTIVCLPHRVLVKVENRQDDLGLDGVSY